MRRIARVLTFLSLVLSSPSLAQEMYVTVNGGLSVPVDATIRGSGLKGEIEYDSGWNVGGAVGIRFLHYFRTEAALSYRQADVWELKVRGGPTLDGTGDGSVLTPMLNVYADSDFVSPVQMYVGAGVGAAFLEANSSGSSNVLIIDDNDTEFAYNFMGGLTYDLLDTGVELDLGYRYVGTTDAKFDAVLVGVGSGNARIDVGIHEMVVGVRYNF